MVVNVPNVPGVPSVEFASLTNVLTLLTQDVVGLFFGSPSAPWGIYQGGGAVVSAESAIAFDYQQQWSLSDYPVEQGGFESYNKVAVPFSTVFRFASSDRSGMLSSIAAIAGDTNLYDIVTPDAVYVSVNINRYDYSQTATEGVGLLQVDIYTTEVRVVGGGFLQSTQSPSSSAQINNGSVQPVNATSPQVQQGALVTGTNGRVVGGV